MTDIDNHYFKMIKGSNPTYSFVVDGNCIGTYETESECFSAGFAHVLQRLKDLEESIKKPKSDLICPRCNSEIKVKNVVCDDYHWVCNCSSQELGVLCEYEDD